MRTFTLLFCSLLLAGATASAQQTFTGYYINNNGDTTAVSFPGYRQWKNNPAQITVQTTVGQDLVLTPENTREVTITGYDTYRSRRFTRMVNALSPNINYVPSASSDSLEEVNGFLLFLTRSKGVELYKYSDKRRENYFLETADGLVELQHKVYLNNNNQVVKDNRYQQQLQAAFGIEALSDVRMRRLLDRLEYTEASLISFMDRVGGQTAVTKKKYPGEVALMGGVAYNTFDISGGEITRGANTDFKSNFSPVVGATLFAYNQRSLGRNFFMLQAKYYRFKNTGTFDYYAGSGSMSYQSSVFDLGFGLGRSFWQKGGFGAYAAAVPNLCYLPDVKEDLSYRDQPTKSSMLLYNLSLQAGVRLPGNLGVWLHYYLLPVKVENYSYQNPNHRTLQLGVEWRLKKN